MLSKLEILDTTLRDGEQSPKVEAIGPSGSSKLLRLLDKLGFEYLEVGFPLSNKGHRQRIKQAIKMDLETKIAAFGWATLETAKDMLDLGVPAAVLVAKTRRTDVVALNRDPDEYLASVAEAVKMLADNGVEVILDAEHAFQAIIEDDRPYALRLLEECYRSGARRIVLCDTNGKSSLSSAAEVIRITAKTVPLENLGVHFHNSRGRAVALAEMAYELGIRHIQGVFGGFGEGAGNTDLSILIPNLCQDFGCKDFLAEVLKRFALAYQKICGILDIPPDPCHPWVGKKVFSTKAGMHAKNPGSYQHAPPEIVGNSSSFGLSELAGRAILVQKAKDMDIIIPDERISEMAQAYKKLAERGIVFGLAEASFKLWLLQELGCLNAPFSFVDLRIVDECLAGSQTRSEASLAMLVNGKECLFNARGDGPVNALEKALRRTLKKEFPIAESVKMSEFSLKTLDMRKGSAALVRILCTFTDGDRVWTTIGVNEDFIQAAWQALLDGYLYRIIMSD